MKTLVKIFPDSLLYLIRKKICGKGYCNTGDCVL